MAEYIDRERLRKELNPYEDDFSQQMSVILQIVDEQPVADVAPVAHGRWIIDESDSAKYECYNAFISYHCSNCLYEMDKEEGQYGWQYGDEPPEKYCPNCGAKMDGGNDNGNQ